MIVQWFLSATVRQAHAMCKHVRKLLNHQRDLLSGQAIEEVNASIRSVRATISANEGKAALKEQMAELERTANKWLKPYPNAVWRENVEVLLVALTVAMGVRTFFLQPFKIPTGSMQPTLYGVTSVPDFAKVNYRSPDRAKVMAQINEQIRQRDAFKIPTGLERIKKWFEGISYVHVISKYDGVLEKIDPPLRFLIFNIKQTIWIGGQKQTIWFPPDYGEEPLQVRTGLRTSGDLQQGQMVHKGDEIVKMKIATGDHLFVDRFTYNFRAPRRGEIVVFETKGIPEEHRARYDIPANQFYIKRLIGLGDETLSIHGDYLVTNAPFPLADEVPVGNVVVNGNPITAQTPHFEDLYSFYDSSPDSKIIPYKENHYYGHAMIGHLEQGQEFHVARDNLFVMGDNTMNSLDSRYWGDFPESSVIGRAFFVYWPLTPRFGWECVNH